MKLRWTLTAPILLLAAWAGLLCAAQAAPRTIRLRNEVITTETAAAFVPTATAAQGADRAVSGLYLIQFTNHFQAGWQVELRASGVELLRYVPDDAFVARLDNASLRQLKALPFVHWIGEYRPEHKLHGALKGVAGRANAPTSLGVTVMVSPKATGAELARVRGILQSLQQETQYRFGGVMRGQIAPARLERLAQSPAVLWIEPGPKIKLFDEVSSEIVGGEGDPTCHCTFTQQYGFDGREVRVAVADSGLYTGNTNAMHPDLAGRVFALFYYGSLTDPSDEHSHGTHVTGIIAGNAATGEVDENMNAYGLGVASGSGIIVQRIFDGTGEYEAPPSFEVLTHDAVRAGADIGSNSWGDDTQGRYDVSAAEFDALVRDADAEAPGDQQYFLEFSAGNAGPGPQTIGSPAVAKNVIATGAAQSARADLFQFDEGEDAMADFSSRGPCEDGRIKPDVVAPGTWIASLRSPVGDDNNAWLPISENYLYQGGTSQAGPHVSGTAAVFVQYYRQTYAIGTPSPALVKAALINSAVDMNDESGTTATPNMDEGWGRVDLTEIILSERSHNFVDQTALLTNGQIYERQIIISSTNYPLKITLAYTDVPGFPAAIPALVNDLDLELIGPDGRAYRGNQFENGESVPDAPSFDNINNVEGIHIAAPIPGEYRVRVIGRNIAQDARIDTPAWDQDFALVICGEIPPPETGSVLLDRPAYRAPSRIKVKVIDLDLASEPSIAVLVRSATEPGGEPLSLLAAGGTGVLTGSIATVTIPVPAIRDNKLQIAHGDWIQVEYYDASEGVLRTATAVADLMPPVVSHVSVTNRFGQTVVSWLTDEPANSVVRFGTNAVLNRSATNSLITIVHEVELTNLIAGRTYYFDVESTDLAGNVTVTNNSGMLYIYVPQPAATILLVDAYINDPDAPFIPLSAYTNALQQIGVTFDVWDINSRPMPTLANLRPYQIVVWRINDSFLNRSSDTIPTAQQNALQQYLNSGGSFFMASMEILSRLGPVPFRTNVLHVQQFIPNPNLFPPGVNCDEDIGVPGIDGVQADPISDNMTITLDYSQFPEIEGTGIGPDLGDTFTPSTNVTATLINQGNNKPCGMRYPRTGQDSMSRAVFLSFPLEAVPDSGSPSGNRASLLRNAIQFLAPGLGGFGTIAFNGNSYRLPDLITLEVADSDLTGLPSATVNVWSDSVTTPVTITLRETTRPGLFRGLIPIVSDANPPAQGVLRAHGGDHIYAEYFDASGNLTIQASATVDTVVPTISGLTAEAGFDEAMVIWQTSEPADALVQFGESSFLGRTAYNPDLEFDHELRLNGLLPDHTYYFQVVSRDAAGNTAVDPDNNGQLYTFRTKVPLRPPFYDDMESGGTNWTVFTGDDSTARWELGHPSNSLEPAAHSPENCWGSSLRGESHDSIDTFLISPAIELTGGNVAALRFWHRYDFTQAKGSDILQYGELLIVTNSLSDPITLTSYDDENFAWEQEQIDLTPYVGRVVFLVWHHYLLAVEPASRPGWLVDDVEVSVTNVPTGIIQISNNLAQARFSLVGPISRNGQGWSTVITNATPGQYVLTYGPVPYYQTPERESNTVVSGGTVTFRGLYTFPDANTNGMSDTWEQQFFGTVSPNRTRSTDTDGDGFSDFAEFIAGTNPILTNSCLRLFRPIPQSNGAILLDWPSVGGHVYQVQGTLNFGGWGPLTGWLQSTGGMMSVTVPAPGPTVTHHNYRLEVRP